MENTTKDIDYLFLGVLVLAGSLAILDDRIHDSHIEGRGVTLDTFHSYILSIEGIGRVDGDFTIVRIDNVREGCVVYPHVALLGSEEESVVDVERFDSLKI